MRKRKSKSMVASLALALCMLLLMGATLAWSDFTQSKTNKFRSTTDPDVTLHDEFDGKENKDVFVENSGDSEVYVRVRLDEYMEVDGVSFATTATAKNKASWLPHAWPQEASKDITDCVAISDSPTHLFHSYYSWTVDGSSRLYHPGTPGLVYTKLGIDGTVDTSSGTTATALAQTPVTMRAYIEAKIKVDAGTTLTGTDASVWQRVTAGCWILDADGWAYWSRVLKPSTATNLLLSAVQNIAQPATSWYYGIDVKCQAVTANDFSKWNTSPYTKTANADELTRMWTKP